MQPLPDKDIWGVWSDSGGKYGGELHEPGWFYIGKLPYLVVGRRQAKRFARRLCRRGWQAEAREMNFVHRIRFE